jgi:sarcosine oxidase subunit alpha
MTMLGHVTSSYWSDALGRSIALAVVAGGREREGQRLHVPMPDRTISATVVASTVFYDPENTRLSA